MVFYWRRVDVTVDIYLSFLQYLYLVTLHLLPGDEVRGALVFYVLQAGVQPLVLVTVRKKSFKGLSHEIDLMTCMASSRHK